MDIRSLLPNAPQMGAESLDAWLRAKGCRGREGLRYRKRVFRDPLTAERLYYAECSCTACSNKWDSEIYLMDRGYPRFENRGEAVGNGEYTNCPFCGTRVEAAYYDRLRRNPMRKTLYPWEIVSSRGHVFFLCWAVEHEIGDDYDSLIVHRRNAYVLDPLGSWHRFTSMARCGWSNASPMEYIGSWYEKNKFDVADGGCNFILPVARDVFENTPLENSKLEVLLGLGMGVEFLRYARIYMRHKEAENLAMQSPHLMSALLWAFGNVTGLDWIDWKSKKPHEMLRVTKPEYKKLCTLAGDSAKGAASLLYAQAACVEWGISKTYAKTLSVPGASFAFRHKKDKLLRPFGLVSIWNYILKQQDEDVLCSVGLCEDYWKDLSKVDANTKDRAVIFPANLKNAHARVISAIKYAEDEALKKKFQRVFKKLSPLQWEHDGLVIVPALSESELIAEGKTLGHCVGGYGKDHCAGRSIFFVRRASERDIPYYTLQLDTKNGRVIQNRGKKNCSRTNEVEAFERLWLAKIVMPWIQKKGKRKSHE